jgi:hypothetical protein
VRGVSDCGLIEIANLNIDLFFDICDRPKIPYVAVAADPHRGSVRKILTSGGT